MTKVVMTLLVRDEADIIDANLAFHLNAGIDHIVVTDNKSRDGTLEILQAYVRDGCVDVLLEDRDDMHQGDWVTRMARLAATELGADWVVNADADEFWWPLLGSFKEVLARVPARFATVRAFMRNFVPCEGRGDFAERMTFRLVSDELSASSPFRKHPFQPQDKVIHRAHPRVTVSEGNHDADWDGSIDLRGWWPFEILHFPIRSVEQLEIKRRNWARHGYSGYGELLVGSAEAYYEGLLVDDATAARAEAEGWLVADRRLRDLLCAVRRQGASPVSDDGSDSVALPAPTLAEIGAFAGDVAAGAATHGAVKAVGRATSIEARVDLLEHPPWRRVATRLPTGLCRAPRGTRPT